jgi:L-lactate permease
MPTALAALPILVVVLAMAVLRWRAALAGAARLCVALGVVFGGSGGGGILVAGVAAEAASSTLSRHIFSPSHTDDCLNSSIVNNI